METLPENKDLLNIILTFFLRCGYVLVHIGLTPTKNVNNIYMQHLFNIGATSAVYFLFGNMLALGEDWNGLIGVSQNNVTYYTDEVSTWTLFMHSSSIVQLVTAGRIRFIGDIISTLLFSGLLYPIVIHSAWSEKGWMKINKIISDVQYKDIGGGSIVHLFAGGYAFTAMKIIGGGTASNNKFYHNYLETNAPATTILGYLTVIFSTIGLMLQSPYIPPENQTLAQMNCITAFGTGVVITTLVYLPTMKLRYWTIIWILQGGLASVITLSSGIGTYNQNMSFIYATAGVSIYILMSLRIRTASLEDYCNIASVNMMQGLLGSIITALNFDSPIQLKQVLWQFICSGMIFIFGALSSTAIHFFMIITNLLRNQEEQENLEEMSRFEQLCCPFIGLTQNSSNDFHKQINVTRKSHTADKTQKNDEQQQDQEPHTKIQV